MPISLIGAELLQDEKLFYGDPCYSASWGSTKAECRRVGNHGDHLALQVLDNYGIQVSPDSDAGYTGGQYSTDYLCCCPLDIHNQDPVAVMNMSLQAKLLDEEYWECYADEFGRAKFVQVLDGPSETSALSPVPRIQHCVPTIQPADIADLIIVNGADPAPFRKCGEWYTVVDGTISVVKNRKHVFFDDEPSDLDIASEAKAVAYTWGEVTGYNPNFGGSFSVDSTCEFGVFNQYGQIIYPDFERKQVYKDGIRDIFELQGFEQVLFWVKDVIYDFPEGLEENIMRHYQLSFTKSSEIPVNIINLRKVSRRIGREYFGPMCDIREGDAEYDLISRSVDYPDTGNTADLSCQSVQGAVATAQAKLDSYAAWASYSIPTFLDYAVATTDMSFKEVSKWNIAGTSICDDNLFDSLYDSTTQMMANASILNDWNATVWQSQEWVDLGYQKERRTIDIGNGYWMEIPAEVDPITGETLQEKYGKPIYAFKAAAPKQGTYQSDFETNVGWHNPIYDTGMLLSYVGNRYVGTGLSIGASGDYDPAGHLFGMDDTLFLLHDIWAKATVNRPGISIVGHGRGVDSLLPYLKMRVMPVYRVDFPAGRAAAGENWPAPGCDYCLDPYEDLMDNSYCDIPPDVETCSEKLLDASNGNVLELTLPFLFPDFSKYNPAPGGSTGGDRSAFDENCSHCARVARFLWDYIKTYKDEPRKSFTYICGPPKTQEEVPQLGHSIRVPGGELRCVNSIAYQYSDAGSFTVNIEVGPVHIASAIAGRITNKETEDVNVVGRIISHEYGALYKVEVPGIGVVKAWNLDVHPWDTGDRVDLTLYNHPRKL